MIPRAFLYDWQSSAPWAEMHQVEQDLVLTRAVIELYSDPLFKDAFAFRGGTAMQKLFFDVPVRYSEDIDLVQIRAEPIGPAIDAIRKCLDPWLDIPKRSRKPDRVTLYYRFQSEIAPIIPMRLKIEINTGEHFTVLPLKHKKFEAQNGWFSGSAEVITYEVEELLGTKLRALYQRKKGRDLYDLAMALQHFPKLDLNKTVQCFSKYMEHEESKVSRAQFEENLAGKLNDSFFLKDIQPLLAPNSPVFDAVTEYGQVEKSFLSLLPGEPWKSKADAKKKERK